MGLRISLHVFFHFAMPLNLTFVLNKSIHNCINNNFNLTTCTIFAKVFSTFLFSCGRKLIGFCWIFLFSISIVCGAQLALNVFLFHNTTWGKFCVNQMNKTEYTNKILIFIILYSGFLSVSLLMKVKFRLNLSCLLRKQFVKS